MAVDKQSREFRFGEFRVLADVAQLLRGDEHVPLVPKAIRLLIALIERRDRVVTKDELLDLVWAGVTVEEGNIAYTVNQIRKVLGKDAIKTVSKLGYRFAPVLKASPPPVATVVQAGTNLPVRSRRLIGRDAETDRLDALLAEHRMVTVVGPPGVGKTSLCKAVTRRVVGRIAAGAWYLDVSNGADTNELAAAIASLIGAKIRVGADAVMEVAAAIGPARMMLVLDGCEAVRDAVAALATTLLDRCGNLSLLATSRSSLRVAGERVMRLKPLAIDGAPDTIAEAARIPAVALFLDRAAAVNADFRLSEADVGRVVRLCRSLDGLPLALEMVGARAPTLGLGVLQERLAEIFLRSESALRSAFDLSWSLLGERQRRLLRALSVFAGSFDFDAADACSRGDTDPVTFVDCLAELIDASLLVIEDGEIPRYRLLDTVRAYLRERVSPEEWAALQRAVAEHYANRMRRADREWNLLPEEGWLAELLPCVDDLRSALRWAFSSEGEVRLGLVIAGRSAQLWSRLQLYGEAERWFEIAVDKLEEVEAEPDVAGAVWRGLGAMLQSSDPGRGIIALQRAEALFRAAGDHEGEGRALYGLGMYHALRREHQRAEELLNRAHTLLAEGDCRRSYSHCLNGLSYLYASTGRHAEAMQSLRDALKIAKGMDDPVAIGGIELSLAELSFVAGDPDTAARRAAAAIARLRGTRSRQVAFGVFNLAIYLEAGGRPAEARRVAAEALLPALARGDEVLVPLIELVALLGLDANIILSANLLGWVEATVFRRSQPRQEGGMVICGRIENALTVALDAATLADAQADGAVWSRDEVVEVAAALLAAADERESRTLQIVQLPSAAS